MANFSRIAPNNMNTTTNGFLMNLPSHIILEILIRLPPKSVIQCKVVCKAWLELIAHPSFVAFHFAWAQSRPGLVVHQCEMFKNFLRLVYFQDRVSQHGLGHDTMATFDLSTMSVLPDADIVVDGSVNGFLFLRDTNYKHEAFYIVNPVTRECMALPKPSGVVRFPYVVTHGFGVSPISGEYKVVRVRHDRELDPINSACLSVPYSDCQVYTLGTGEWRRVGPAPFAYNCRFVGLYLNGLLHWLIQDLEGHELISCFDLENEVFQPFPPPFPGRKLQATLGVLRGCLCLCDNSSESDIDIWVMKEYEVGKSWSKEIAIRKMPELVGPSLEVVFALQLFRDGTILLLWGDFFLIHYSGKTQVAREVDVEQPRGPNSIEAMHYVPSFLSLRSFLMEQVSMF